MQDLNSKNPVSDNALIKSEIAVIGSCTTEITPHQTAQSEPSEQPISFSFNASHKQLITLILGGCVIFIIAMTLSGGICLGVAGMTCNMNGVPTSNPIGEDFLSMAIALGAFFAISGPLGLSAIPALAVSMGIWFAVKGILSF
jgi:hypothetical protein